MSFAVPGQIEDLSLDGQVRWADRFLTSRRSFAAGRYCQPVLVLPGRSSAESHTNSPTGEGKFFVVMMAVFAELERDMIRERTMAGLAAARAQGRIGGHPTVMDADTLAAAQVRHANGESPTQIAKALGVSRASIYRHLPAGSPRTMPPNRSLSANHCSATGQTPK